MVIAQENNKLMEVIQLGYKLELGDVYGQNFCRKKICEIGWE